MKQTAQRSSPVGVGLTGAAFLFANLYAVRHSVVRFASAIATEIAEEVPGRYLVASAAARCRSSSARSSRFRPRSGPHSR